MKIHDTISTQFAKRLKNPSIPAIKINLYNGKEVKAVKSAINHLNGLSGFTSPDCFMVGDSLLTTHMMQENTHLESVEEQDAFIKRMLDAIADVRFAMDKYFEDEERPYLIGDLPDGSSSSKERLLQVSKKMITSGADVIKLEIATKSDLILIKHLVVNNIPVAAHVGYVPQKNKNRKYGQTLDEALELIHLVHLAGEYGACAIILERIAEELNSLLCNPSKNKLPIYSIFSGKAQGGGQSLNVWDSVYKPGFKSNFFPPTAQFTTDTYPNSYTHDKIAECFYNLLKMTLEGNFPKSPSKCLASEDILYLESMDPL